MKTAYRILLAFSAVLFCVNICSGDIMTQTSYRWRNDDGDVYSATWKDSVNTTMAVTDNNNIRLRIEFKTEDKLSANISLGYKENHFNNPWTESTPWIMINRSDTGKFILSPSNYLQDRRAFADNHLLLFTDSNYVYQGTITFDSSESYYMNLLSGKLLYEFEYSIKPLNIKPGSAYFFTILKDSIPVSYEEEAVLLTPPVSWYPKSFGAKYNSYNYWISDISFVDANTGFAVGGSSHYGQNESLILRTTDGGITWTEQKCPVNGMGGLAAVCFTSQDVGTAVGGGGIIVRTTNGGKNWVSTISGLTYYFNSVSFASADTGIVIGSEGPGTYIFRTVNGGRDWELYFYMNAHLYSVHMIDSKNGYMAGESGTVLKTTDGGQSWKLTSRGTINYLSDLFFTDVNNGYVAGEGVILKTTDGGDTWQLSFHNSSVNLASLYFIDKNTGWAAGSEGALIKTTDGGKNWFELPICTLHQLYSIQFTDEKSGWVLGGSSKIFRTTDGGISAFTEGEEKHNIPERFYLSQNYPNPFNPETKIKYSVPYRAYIVIEVYDILGEETARLVSEEKPAGNYKVNWNAKNLTSGVYFYQLRAGSYVETKKMMLIR